MAKLITINYGAENPFLQNFSDDENLADILDSEVAVETLGYDPDNVTATVNGVTVNDPETFIPTNGSSITIQPKPATKAND
ncbi:MAG: hypothetical protein KGZ30_01405 [Anaplasmataceae bacterium]|nr:hypothetical protein [Anaplasmataceae bacterium]